MMLCVFLLAVLVRWCEGHGRLVDPPSRSSMWRFGFNTKPNYNDNELFCGGYTVQWQRNGGKCGVCGDNWSQPSPRPNEAGGVYGRGVIARDYKPGQIIKSRVELTANHRGFFEFKLCPHNSPTTVVSQDCLDKYLLEMADGSGPRYYPGPGTGSFNVELKLPDRVTCSQCVFQWTYTAGNNWGRCEDGSSAVGCGPQETFRGCSDISIGSFESNDIPTSQERPWNKPSISAIPPRPPNSWEVTSYTTRRPYNRPVSNDIRPPVTRNRRPSTTRRPYFAPVSKDVRPVTRRPIYYHRRPSTTRRPYKKPQNPKRPTSNYNGGRPTSNYNGGRRPGGKRPSTYKPIYTPRPTPYRPIHSNNRTPVVKKNKDSTKKTTNLESSGGGCRAVGVWASISGIASWCDSNCARGYCPSTHCDCS